MFKESKRLLSTQVEGAPLSLEKRATIAREAIRQAITPTSIDQGRFKTCNVTTVEVSLYSKKPSAVLKAITDVALTGRFETHPAVAGGRRYAINVDRERTLNNYSRYSGRTFASQIFQDLAVDIHHKTDGRNNAYNHKVIGGQSVTDRYGRVIDDNPSLDTRAYPNIYKRIAGDRRNQQRKGTQTTRGGCHRKRTRSSQHACTPTKDQQFSRDLESSYG